MSLAACNHEKDESAETKFNPEEFLSRLEKGGFLSHEIISDLPDFRDITDELDYAGDNIYLYFYKADSENNTIHKIEAVTTSDNLLIRYHYMAYLKIIPFLDEKLTLDEGKELAMQFIKEFRPDLSDLTWENNEWYLSIYDPDNVEAWVADNGTHKYGVMVNLNTGQVIHFNRDDM